MKLLPATSARRSPSSVAPSWVSWWWSSRRVSLTALSPRADLRPDAWPL